MSHCSLLWQAPVGSRGCAWSPAESHGEPKNKGIFGIVIIRMIRINSMGFSRFSFLLQDFDDSEKQLEHSKTNFIGTFWDMDSPIQSHLDFARTTTSSGRFGGKQRSYPCKPRLLHISTPKDVWQPVSLYMGGNAKATTSKHVKAVQTSCCAWPATGMNTFCGPTCIDMKAQASNATNAYKCNIFKGSLPEIFKGSLQYCNNAPV